MARNYFSRSDAMDVINAGEQGWNDTQDVFDRVTARQAGSKYAAGDKAGAAGILAKAGMIDDARTINKDITDEEDRATEAADEQKRREREGIARSFASMKQLASALAQIPLGNTPEERAAGLQKRHAFLQQAIPMAEKEVGAPLDDFRKLTPDQLDDANIVAFGGELEKQFQQILKDTETGEIVGVSPRGETTTIRKGTPKPIVLKQGDRLMLGDPTSGYREGGYNPKTYQPRPSGGGSRGPAKRSAQDMTPEELLAVAMSGGR